MSEPILRRRFQMTEFDTNHNKYWQVELYADGMMKTEWGRVGVVNKPSVKYHQNQASVERIIREKEKKGYVEVRLHVPESHVVMNKKKAAVKIVPEVQSLIDMIFIEAGKQQKTYLKVGIEELSQHQIDDARKVLLRISDMNTEHQRDPSRYNMGEFSTLAELYYNLIPTKLPAKISARAVVGDLLSSLSEQEDRLNQLSAGIAGYKRRVVNKETGIEALGGTKIELLDFPSKEHEEVYQLIYKTKGYQHYTVQNIFRVTMPNERKRYEDNEFGSSRQRLLLHGTNNYNLQFILSEENGCGGLIVPKVHSHGRFYGDGLYFSPESQKSYNYTHTTTGLVTLLVCRVALGREQLQDKGCQNRTQCDPGYESLRSLHTPSGMTEILVYRNEQSTVSYVATAK